MPNARPTRRGRPRLDDDTFTSDTHAGDTLADEAFTDRALTDDTLTDDTLTDDTLTDGGSTGGTFAGRRIGAEPDDEPDLDAPPEGDRWSTWDQSTAGERGPRPHPHWLVTELAAVDTDLGMLKTGKEADVFLLRRSVPGTDRSCLLATKRYRDAEHRMFRRDDGYLDGRRVRRSRTNRAMANRTAFGRRMIAGQWAAAEFDALCQLYEADLPVPYPAQLLGTELLMEFVGESDGTAAPRLAETRRRGDDLVPLWEQAVEIMEALARGGMAHGDLSAYNMLVHHDRLVLIDLPQVVDVVAHPRGRDYLDRDAGNVAAWFRGHGLPDDVATPPDDLPAVLRYAARLD